MAIAHAVMHQLILTRMKMMTEQEKAALESHCEFMISEHIKYGGYSDDEQIYRIALAALTAEPVAWEVKGILCHTKEDADRFVGEPEPLYECAPVALTAQPAPAIPDGWNLVPVVPTEAMLLLLGMTGSFDAMTESYQKALAAAPIP